MTHTTLSKCYYPICNPQLTSRFLSQIFNIPAEIRTSTESLLPSFLFNGCYNETMLTYFCLEKVSNEHKYFLMRHVKQSSREVISRNEQKTISEQSFSLGIRSLFKSLVQFPEISRKKHLLGEVFFHTYPKKEEKFTVIVSSKL